MSRFVRAFIVLVSSVLLMTGIATPAHAATVTTKGLLGKLDLRAEKGSASYDRAKFKHWVDADGDGCDTREEVLIIESSPAADRDADCTVTSGTWETWYDIDIWFEPGDVDIDHLVPLKEAWESGARRWGAAKRTAFANDLGYAWSLEGVTDNVNQSKGDRDPSQWLPAFNKCQYAMRFAVVKYRWGLSIDRRERAKLARIFTGGCGNRQVKLPAKGTTAMASGRGTPGTSVGNGIPADPIFGTCAEVVAAGLGPYVRGVDAEYYWYRDGDGDGLACETASDDTITPPPSGGTDPRFQYCYQVIDAGSGPYVRGVDPEYDWYTDADSDGVVCES